MEDECLARSLAQVPKRRSDETQEFVGGHDLLRRRNTRVGNHRGSRDGFIGLMKLQARFVAALDIRATSGVFEMNSVAVALVGARQLVERSQCLAVEPWFERKLLGLLLTIAERDGDGLIDDFFL